MPTPQEILSDPNYINANPATQQAIRDKFGIQAAAPKDESGMLTAVLGKPKVDAVGNAAKVVTEGAKYLRDAGVSYADKAIDEVAANPTAQNAIKNVKDVAKGTVSVLDTGINILGAIGEWGLQGPIRTVTSSEEAYQKSRLPKDILGKKLGIENDPAYTGQATKYYGKKLLESDFVQYVSENLDKGADWISEKTGVPKRDVVHMMESLSFGFPIKGVPKVAPVVKPVVKKVGDVVGAVDDKVTQSVTRLADEAGIRKADALRNPVPVTDNISPQTKAQVLLEDPQPKVLPPEAPAVVREGAPESTLSGVGSASVDKAAQRTATAENLDVPIKLTEGQRTQELAQQKLENQLKYGHSKEDAGRAISVNEAKQNLAFKQNFDFMIDEIGSLKSGDRVATGQLVTDNLKRQVDIQKKLIDRAYRKAENAGETKQFVDTTPLYNEIKAIDDVTKYELAPVIKMVERHLVDEEGNLKPMTLGEYQKLRQAVTAAGDAGPNGHWGSIIKEIIDTSTENSGGRYYQEARKLYRDFKKEFEEKGMIERLTTTKKNSSDHKIAVEDVFQKSVISGTKQDLVNLVERLKKGGKGGEQALVEIRGNLIDYIYEQATKGVGKDIQSQAVPSFPQLKRTVKALQDDGKLEYLLGKDQARKVMNLMEVADSLYNELPGSKNYSQTAYTLNEKAIEVLKGVGRKIPGGDALIKIAEEKARLKQALEAINPDTEKLNKKLRDLQKREIEILQKGE